MTFFIAYLRCISSLHIFIAYLHCISALHIFTAYLHCIYSLHLHCISSLLIFNAQLRRKVFKNHYVFHQHRKKSCTFDENPCGFLKKTHFCFTELTFYMKNCKNWSLLMKILVVFCIFDPRNPPEPYFWAGRQISTNIPYILNCPWEPLSDQLLGKNVKIQNVCISLLHI